MKFDDIEKRLDVEAKLANTIVEPFLYEVHKRPIGDDLKVQFWNCLSSWSHPLKRYVEWRRISPSTHPPGRTSDEEAEQVHENKKRKFNEQT